jgi:alkylated DNA repair dioxygenase AlkB
VTLDLFASPEVQRVALQDAEVHYWPRFLPSELCAPLLSRLIEETPWRSDPITVWGRTVLQPRGMAWYGDPHSRYTYSGLRLEPLPWTETLTALRQQIESAVGAPFNSALLNYYRDQRDSMGLHSDDEPELGPRPVIASLTLGEPRPFVLAHRTRRELPRVRLPLASGSLLLMRGDTQRHWKHGIEKRARPCGPRVNLTFRYILAPGERPPASQAL